MHTGLLILTILVLAAYRILMAPLLALAEILALVRDKWLRPIEVQLETVKGQFEDEVFDRNPAATLRG